MSITPLPIPGFPSNHFPRPFFPPSSPLPPLFVRITLQCCFPTLFVNRGFSPIAYRLASHSSKFSPSLLPLLLVLLLWFVPPGPCPMSILISMSMYTRASCSANDSTIVIPPSTIHIHTIPALWKGLNSTRPPAPGHLSPFTITSKAPAEGESAADCHRLFLGETSLACHWLLERLNALEPQGWVDGIPRLLELVTREKSISISFQIV
ncbi:hypothetical protein K474DRAFT_626657 [Panus rudis PR-1116 ss-1]|nr:hypothetical protein K474DRAFT_626657 [Panus rudis PR-1116 ss-1]